MASEGHSLRSGARRQIEVDGGHRRELAQLRGAWHYRLLSIHSPVCLALSSSVLKLNRPTSGASAIVGDGDSSISADRRSLAVRMGSVHFSAARIKARAWRIASRSASVGGAYFEPLIKSALTEFASLRLCRNLYAKH